MSIRWEGVCLAVTTSLVGQDSEGLQDLKALYQTKVVVATRTLLDSMQVPGTVFTVTSEQIRARGYRSLTEVIRDLPDVKVDQGVDAEVFNLVGIRGIGNQTRFLLLLDGVRIGAASNEFLPLLENFPVFMAKRVEVLYGPASAIYGADALSGVINIVPFSPAEGQAEAALWGGDHGVRGGQALWGGSVTERALQLQVAGQVHADDGVDGSDRYPDFRNNAALRTGTFQTAFGPVTPTYPIGNTYSQPIRTQSLMAQVKGREVSFLLFANAYRIPSSSSYTPDNAVKTADPFLAARTLMGSLGWTTQATEELEFTTRLTGRLYEMNPGSYFANLFVPGLAPGYKFARSQEFRLEQGATWEAGGGLLLAAGLTASSYQSIPQGTDLVQPVDPVAGASGAIHGLPPGQNAADFYHVSGTVLGGFLQAQYQPSLQWSFTLGGRFDQDSRYGSAWNPRLGLVWTPTSASSLKFLYGTAFLAPSPYLAFRNFGSFYATGPGTYASAFWHLPNPGLRPEKGQTTELSYRYLWNEQVGLTAALHRTRLKDLHTLLPDAGTTNRYGGTYKGWPVGFIEVTANQGEQVNQGWMLQVDLLRPLGSGRLTAYASWSQQEGDLTDRSTGTGEGGLIAPHMAKAGVDWAQGPLSASLRMLWLGPQRSAAWDPTRPGKRLTVGGYRDLSAHAAWTFHRAIEGFLRVDNALDGKARHVGEDAFTVPGIYPGTPQPGRRWVLGVRAKF